MNQLLTDHPCFYSDPHTQLYCGDALELLARLPEQCADMIFADPPYFLSDGGITCKSGKMADVNKGAWDEPGSLEEKHRFNRTWIRLCRRALNDCGTIWISGTLHNIYSVGMALEQEGFKILNNITWQKTNPPPNLACRCFTHSTETVLWAKKDLPRAKHYFDYQTMKQLNGGKQMKDVWTGPLIKPSEKKHGKHPTQKPIYLLERIVLASSRPGDCILDPFCGSGTTGVAARSCGRDFIGIDLSPEYLALTRARLEDVQAGDEPGRTE